MTRHEDVRGAVARVPTPAPTPSHVARLRRRMSSAALGAVMLCLLVPIALWTAWGQASDTLMMEAAARWVSPADRVFPISAGAINTVMMLVAAGVVALVCLLRRRPTLAGRAVGLILVANLATQAFKHVLARPDLGVTIHLDNSLPSGHTTFAASLALALVIVAPEWLRGPAAWIGWAWASLVGAVVIVHGWHRPSDVVAGILVAGVTALVVAPVEARRRHLARAGKVRGVIVLVLLGAALVLTVAGLLGVPVTTAAELHSGMSFSPFLAEHPWRATFLACADVAWVGAFCGVAVHEVDRLCA